MPEIFDNIKQQLLEGLQRTLKESERADFCVGYFNLRGWDPIGKIIEAWPGGEGHCCRLLVGMQATLEKELREALSPDSPPDLVSQAIVLQRKRDLAVEFRRQLMMGVPNNHDESALQRLASQIRAKKLVVKLFTRTPLHAKLYLLFKPGSYSSPRTGFLGSSNLTLAGISKQGELNIDVADKDATGKLERWFEDRWTDQWCLDISKELLEVLGESWASEQLVSPYHIYLKMAYHLSEEARTGIASFTLPKEFNGKLFDFQDAAVKIAAHRNRAVCHT